MVRARQRLGTLLPEEVGCEEEQEEEQRQQQPGEQRLGGTRVRRACGWVDGRR